MQKPLSSFRILSNNAVRMRTTQHPTQSLAIFNKEYIKDCLQEGAS
jgi:hypothetical protein